MKPQEELQLAKKLLHKWEREGDGPSAISRTFFATLACRGVRIAPCTSSVNVFLFAGIACSSKCQKELRNRSANSALRNISAKPTSQSQTKSWLYSSFGMRDSE